MAAKQLKKYDIFNDSSESYYWLGFLFADGSFNKDGTIVLKLAIKDLHHVEKFKKFTGSSNQIMIRQYKTKFKSTPSCQFKICDKYNIGILSKKFNIQSNKTKNPPIVRTHDMTDTQFLSLLIGFIDGDGWIYYSDGNLKGKYPACQIKVHGSWFSTLQIMEDNIRKISNIDFKKDRCSINSDGLALLYLSKNELLKYIKTFAITNNLPILDRKWNKIII